MRADMKQPTCVGASDDDEVPGSCVAIMDRSFEASPDSRDRLDTSGGRLRGHRQFLPHDR